MTHEDASVDGGARARRARLYALALIDCLALAALFGLLAYQANQPMLGGVDQASTNWIRAHRAEWPAVSAAARSVTVLGNTSVATVIVLATFATWYALAQGGYLQFRVREASFWLAVILVGRLLCSGFKLWLRRERPPALLHLVEETTFSFPSGHSNFAALAFGFLMLATLRMIPPRFGFGRWAAALGCLLLTILIAASRIWLGVHYPTDVMAGYALGLIWFLLALMLETALGLHRIIDPTQPPRERRPSA